MKNWIWILGLIFLLVFGAFVYEFNFKQNFAEDNQNSPSINDLFVNVYFLFFGVVIFVLILFFFSALLKRKK